MGNHQLKPVSCCLACSIYVWWIGEVFFSVKRNCKFLSLKFFCMLSFSVIDAFGLAIPISLFGPLWEMGSLGSHMNSSGLSYVPSQYLEAPPKGWLYVGSELTQHVNHARVGLLFSIHAHVHRCRKRDVDFIFYVIHVTTCWVFGLYSGSFRWVLGLANYEFR